MQVYKIKCLNCKEETQLANVKILFKEGCPLCKSKRVKLLGYGKEEKELLGKDKFNMLYPGRKLK